MAIYNVLTNSNSRVAGGATTSLATYYFDWRIMEQGEYLLTWGFTSSNVNTTTNRVALISTNLGQCNVFSIVCKY